MKNNCLVEQYIIKDQECGYLSKGGRFIRLLTAGKYTFLKMQGLSLIHISFDDQCTGANPRYPLMSEIKEMYLKAYYGK